MKKLSSMFGMDEEIARVVEAVLHDRTLTRFDIGVMVKQRTETLADDIYSTMRDVSMIKFSLVEIETKLNNLADFCNELKKSHKVV